MRIKFLKFYITSFFILSNVLMFAQGDEDNNGDLEGNDPPPVPINNKLILLLFVGLIYSVYVFNKQKKQTQIK